MLYIDPDECIDCGACEPECPWQAIFDLNHALLEQKDNFKVKAFVQGKHPNADEVAANKKKWGLDPNA
jgi:ferredoxin